MPALTHSALNSLVVDDELLLAMCELELSTAARQDQPPRARKYCAAGGVPRPSQRCPEEMIAAGASEQSLHRPKPLRVYSRSPPPPLPTGENLKSGL